MALDIDHIIRSVTGIAIDSRLVQPNFIYFAINGMNFNGEDFIGDAIDFGARYIVVQQNFKNIERFSNKAQCFIFVENIRQFLAELSVKFYHPQPSNIVAITGTNGKTSVANFFMQLANNVGYKSAAIGTIGLTSAYNIDDIENNNLTTPDPINLNKMLRMLCDRNFTHVALEASSHGLDQHRLDYIKLQAGAFTNLSRDHLDYHGDMDSYFDAKKRLFSEILEHDKYVVLNADIKEFPILKDISLMRGLRILSYGRSDGSDIRLTSHYSDEIKLIVYDRTIYSQTLLRGDFQIDNLLCAIGLAIACNLSVDKIADSLSMILPVTGRMERHECNGAEIYVDYAHTPDALKRVLISLRKICNGRLIVLFGCGGERDIGKRVLMGQVAEAFADIAIVTDDNPRNEDAANIRKNIMSGMAKCIEIPDRQASIVTAFSLLQKGDILVVAGKGHENYQIIGDKKIYFSDRDVINDLIDKWK